MVWSAERASEYDLKAAYIYRFAQFTTWTPPPFQSFNFCVQGDNPVGVGLAKLQGKIIQNASANLLRIESIDDAKICHVLFLHPARRNDLGLWIAALASRPILTISDLPDAFQEKVMIVFAVEPDRVTFKINRTQANASGLFLSAQILKLAREIR